MIPRMVIAGTGSGVGKTSVTVGLMSLLSRKLRVQGFKVGPDFIDPMFHRAATGRPSRNLDSFLMDRSTIENLFGWSTGDADLAIVEGVRGLYEGLTATGDRGSTAEIARILGAPVILVVNARSLGKSAAAQVLGYRMLDPRVRVEGVVLNQVTGERHRQKATEAVERLTGTSVVGCIERSPESMPERHLGLVTAEEHHLPSLLGRLEVMVADLDLDALLEIARRGGEGRFPEGCPFLPGGGGVTVAVPRDRAFSFYYQENLESMEAAGCEIIEFSPLEGDPLPEADSYYLGGGYPEVHASQLSENRDFLEGLKNASEEGRLVYGECGGMLAMCRSIDNGEGSYSLSGIFPYRAQLTEGRQALSYVRARGTRDNFLFPDREVRGHEFHYTRLLPSPEGGFAFHVDRGKGIDGRHDGIMVRRTVGTYMHQHALSNREWGRAWARCVDNPPA
ncbi:MAG: cobyrinate a,c-diamide synthase [Thermoplasmatota archaeon]